jgi:hypothetical protein
MYHEIAGTLVLIAAVPRKECVKLPASRAIPALVRMFLALG